MKRLAVFDLDGTLVDSAPDLAASLNHCLAAEALAPIALEDVRPHAGHGARAMLRAAYERRGHRWDEASVEAHLPAFLTFYEANIAVDSRPFPHALDAMDALSAAGWHLAVCTNKTERLAVKLLDELGMSQRFDAICGADTFAGMKPDPVHLLGTIERAGGTAGAAVMIGDTDTDIKAARNAGISSILVDFGYGPDESTRRYATAVIADYTDLTPDLLEKVLASRPEERR